VIPLQTFKRKKAAGPYVLAAEIAVVVALVVAAFIGGRVSMNSALAEANETARGFETQAATSHDLTQRAVRHAVEKSRKAAAAERDVAELEDEVSTLAHDVEQLTAKLRSAPERTAPAPARSGGRTLSMTATAYCSCSTCCGPYDGTVTASGTTARWGVVAADTSVLPFGTQIRISGFDDVFTVEDRGGAIKGDRIDIWFPSHAQALAFGRRTVQVEVVGR